MPEGAAGRPRGSGRRARASRSPSASCRPPATSGRARRSGKVVANSGVDEVEDRRGRSGSSRVSSRRPSVGHPVAVAEEQLGPRPPEAVDRLLEVADQEQPAVEQTPAAANASRIAAWIGSVSWNSSTKRRSIPAHQARAADRLGLAGQEVAGEEEQVVVVEPPPGLRLARSQDSTRAASANRANPSPWASGDDRGVLDSIPGAQGLAELVDLVLADRRAKSPPSPPGVVPRPKATASAASPWTFASSRTSIRSRVEVVGPLHRPGGAGVEVAAQVATSGRGPCRGPPLPNEVAARRCRGKARAPSRSRRIEGGADVAVDPDRSSQRFDDLGRLSRSTQAREVADTSERSARSVVQALPDHAEAELDGQLDEVRDRGRPGASRRATVSSASVAERLLDRRVEDDEPGVDAGLDRVPSEDLAAERVDGADPGGFESPRSTPRQSRRVGARGEPADRHSRRIRPFGARGPPSW